MYFNTLKAFHEAEAEFREQLEALPEALRDFLEEVFTDHDELLNFKEGLSIHIDILDEPVVGETAGLAANDNEPELEVHPQSLRAMYPGTNGVTADRVADRRLPPML